MRRWLLRLVWRSRPRNDSSASPNRSSGSTVGSGTSSEGRSATASSMCAGVDDRDPTYFSLVLSFSVEDKSASARQKRLEAVNEATANTKVVKAYLDSDNPLRGSILADAKADLLIYGNAERAVVEALQDVGLVLQSAAPGIDQDRRADRAVAIEFPEQPPVQDLSRV